LQCDKHIEEFYEPTAGEKNAANDYLKTQYLTHVLPGFFQHYDREIWRVEVEKVINFIKLESSPGVPVCMLGSTNGKVLEIMGVRIVETVLDRIELLLSHDPHKFDRMQRIDEGLCDPIRVFVKDEPHKKAKLAEGRVRLIMSVSLIDKIIEMLLIRDLCKLEIANWMDIPSKPGIGFSPEDNQSVYDDVIGCGYTMACADISGWDWSVKQWMILNDAEFTIKLCENSSPVWETLLRRTALIESESIYMFSDGTMVQPRFKGIVNSGKFKTSRSNSFMRVHLATLVGSRKTIAAGDDSVEEYVEGAKETYLALGLKCKDYNKVVDSFDFCSRIYMNGRSYPVNHIKMMMNLVHHSPKDTLELRCLMIGLQDMLKTHPEFDVVMSELDRVGFLELEGTQEIVEYAE
jgi:hypothetical protein